MGLLTAMYGGGGAGGGGLLTRYAMSQRQPQGPQGGQGFLNPNPTAGANFAGTALANPFGGALQPEPIEGDSLTRYLRSITNTGMPTGFQAFGQGQGMIGQGADFWSRILSGNRAAMSEALGPEIARIASGYDQARKSMAQFAPMGGGRSALMGELPFRQAQDVNSLFATVRPQAASQLAQLGVAQSGIGQAMINAILQAMMERRGQNVQEHGQAMGLAGSALNALI